jgi:hypothetical protein
VLTPEIRARRRAAASSIYEAAGRRPQRRRQRLNAHTTLGSSHSEVVACENADAEVAKPTRQIATAGGPRCQYRRRHQSTRPSRSSRPADNCVLLSTIRYRPERAAIIGHCRAPPRRKKYHRATIAPAGRVIDGASYRRSELGASEAGRHCRCQLVSNAPVYSVVRRTRRDAEAGLSCAIAWPARH